MLLVEDEEQVRVLARDMLESNGYEVLLADGGAAALAVCEKRQGKIDLLVTDVVMPKMSGPELAARVRRLRPGIKTVFMSGSADQVMHEQGGTELGAHFLQKPFSPGALARKVREALDAPLSPVQAGPAKEART